MTIGSTSQKVAHGLQRQYAAVDKFASDLSAWATHPNARPSLAVSKEQKAVDDIRKAIAQGHTKLTVEYHGGHQKMEALKAIAANAGLQLTVNRGFDEQRHGPLTPAHFDALSADLAEITAQAHLYAPTDLESVRENVEVHMALFQLQRALLDDPKATTLDMKWPSSQDRHLQESVTRLLNEHYGVHLNVTD